MFWPHWPPCGLAPPQPPSLSHTTGERELPQGQTSHTPCFHCSRRGFCGFPWAWNPIPRAKRSSESAQVRPCPFQPPAAGLHLFPLSPALAFPEPPSSFLLTFWLLCVLVSLQERPWPPFFAGRPSSSPFNWSLLPGASLPSLVAPPSLCLSPLVSLRALIPICYDFVAFCFLSPHL